MRFRSRFVLYRHCAALWPLQILFWLVPGAPGATIHVPTDQPTIQAGINVANNGDTVLVAPGTYFENIDFKGKAITVTSSGGAASTILDGGSVGPAVTFKTSEPRAAVLSNMTIQHGGSFRATQLATGGVYISQSSPTLMNDVITQNNCWGIEAAGAPLVEENEISATQDPAGNCASAGGAAVYLFGNLSSSPTTPPMIVGNTIEDNVESGTESSGGNGGAAIAVWGGTPVIEGNVLRNNSSPGGSGGAINIVGGSGITVVQNLIYGNQAGCGGGGIAFEQVVPNGTVEFLIANNTIVNNTTSQPSPHFSECANISQIYPDPDSYGAGSPSAIIVNNILSGSSLYPAVNCDWFATPSEINQPIFDHNILYNAGGAFFGSYCVDVSAKYGNVAADPKFVNAAGNDYHLQATSPAIDAGNNSALQYFSDVTGEQLAKDFDGNGRVQDATGKGYPIIDIGAYEYAGAVDGSPTTVVLTSSAYIGNAGSGYTLTATLASALGTPTGTVDFFLDGKSIGTSMIGSGGVATLGNFLMTPGVHNLYASYPGQGVFTPAISVIIIVDLNLYTTALTLSSSANPSLPGQAVTFTVTATSADTTYIPSPITLTDTSTNTTLGTLTPNSAGVATITTSNLTNGANAITAVYAGDSSHAAASASLNQVVQGATMTTTTTTLTSSSNPASFGQFVTFTATVANPTSSGGMPTGSVNFSDAGTLLSSQPLAAGSGAVAAFSTGALAVGGHAITATYVPTGSFSASSATLTEVIQSLMTITTLGASPNPAFAGQTVTLSASVAGGVGAPTGTVSFFDGATLLSSGALDASGHATFTTATLGVGSHTLTAVYGGSGIYSTSGSVAVTEVIQPSPLDFTIALANPSLTIETQHHMTTNVTLTSVGGFADSLTVACGVLPAYVTCRLPSPVTLTANGSIAIALYLDTDSVLGYARVDPEPLPGGASLVANLASMLAPFGFFAAAGLGRRKWRGRPDLRLLMLLPAALFAAVALSGCGRIVFPVGIPPSAAAGTYTIPITATGATTAITHTANLTLTVTP